MRYKGWFIRFDNQLLRAQGKLSISLLLSISVRRTDIEMVFKVYVEGV